ncbi:MAG: lipase maturation factor family protein, partial [Chloroflexota bacterium]
FRVMFLSGVVKLGGPTWDSLTALNFHYFTQPLPTPLAWYAHHLPGWVQVASVVAVLVIELVVPFLIFGPRRVRFAAAGIFVLLQLMILLTGNYTFFNVLTIVLCLPLLDDNLLEWLSVPVNLATVPDYRRWGELAVAIMLALLLLPAGAVRLLDRTDSAVVPEWATDGLNSISRWRLVNHYGLFARMTTTRPEIIIEGSNDRETWVPYDFRYKIDSPTDAPPIVAPHQPRLDWQMWFAALGDIDRNRWLYDMAGGLMQGRPEVVCLFAENPFPDVPPTYIRARYTQYTFTEPVTRRATGNWWVEVDQGLYFDVVWLTDPTTIRAEPISC